MLVGSLLRAAPRGVLPALGPDVPIFRKPELRDAVAQLTVAILDDLTASGSSPALAPSPFQLGWRRNQQEIFVADRPVVWSAPVNISQADSLDRFPAMAEVRNIINEDPELSGRFDTTVGPWFNRTYVALDSLLFNELLDPLVRASGSYQFNEGILDDHYLRWESGMLADEVRMVHYLPLCGFEAEAVLRRIDLPGGFVLAPMTDRQISGALGTGAVPIERTTHFTAVQIARQNQWALSITQTYPMEFGYGTTDPSRQPPTFEATQAAGQRLVTALRIVCGGSIAATRCLHGQHEEDFPLLTGNSVSLVRTNTVDLDRPCILFADQIQDLVEIFEHLARLETEQDRTLSLALRRLVFAGTRTEPADRLLDLLICAEALFIKRAGIESRAKGRLIAEAAADLLHGEPELKKRLGNEANPAERIKNLMSTAYRRRNDEMHGEADPRQATVTLLSGVETQDLSAAVEDVDRVLRIALSATLSATLMDSESK
jgi:hypothetical protein